MHIQKRGRIVSLREAGWTYRWIVAHVEHNMSVVCRCFQEWSMEHSDTRRQRSGRPRSTDTRHDRRIVRAAVNAQTSSRKKSGQILHLLCHQGTLGTVCLQQYSDHVCLWPDYHVQYITIPVSAARDWNSLTQEIRGCQTLVSFKRNLILSLL